MIEAERQRGEEGGGLLRRIGSAELRYLMVEDELEGDLTLAARRRVYELLRGLPRPVIGRIADDRLLLDLRCLEDHDRAAFAAQLDTLRERLG